MDNGTEFKGKHIDTWAYLRNIRLDFIRPGTPVENCLIESFNGRVRDGCLGMHWFETLDEARSILEDWRRNYDQTTPHFSLSGLPPPGPIVEKEPCDADQGLGIRPTASSVRPEDIEQSI